MKSLSDDELVTGYRTSQDMTYIAELFLRHSDLGFRLARQYMANEADTEDILQQIFIKLTQSLNQYQIGTNVKAWLMRIIINSCKNKLKEEKNCSKREKMAFEEIGELYEEESKIEKEELQLAIRTSIESLPERYKTPLWLILYEGFSYSEAADTLELPEKTVRTQVRRGVDQLQTMLKPFNIFLSLDAILLVTKNAVLEPAPSTFKKFLESYKNSLAIGSVKNSRRAIKTVEKTKSLSFLNILTISVGVTLAIISIFVFLKSSQNEVFAPVSVVNKNSQKEPPSFMEWDFSEGYDHKLENIIGNLEWSPKHKGVFNSSVSLVSLPIMDYGKPFVIEVKVSLPEKIEEAVKAFISLSWVRSGYFLSSKLYMDKELFKIPKSVSVYEIYFYRGNFYQIFNGKNVQRNKILADLKGANLALGIRNFIVHKITYRTIGQLPPNIAEMTKEKKYDLEIVEPDTKILQ